MKRSGLLAILGAGVTSPLLPPGVTREDVPIAAGNIIVLHHDGSMSYDHAAAMAQEMRERLRRSGHEPSAIVFTSGEMRLEALNEDLMRRFGWVRA